MAQVLSLVLIFFCYIGDVNFSGWKAFLSIFLMLLGNLGLKLISGRGGIRFNLVFILGNLIVVLPIGVFFVFFDQQAIAF